MKSQEITPFITIQNHVLKTIPSIKANTSEWPHIHSNQAILPIQAGKYVFPAFSSQTQKIPQKALASCQKALMSFKKAYASRRMTRWQLQKASETCKKALESCQQACDELLMASDPCMKACETCVLY